MTRPYAEVIGDPIAHSKSPMIHRFWLGLLGIEADYRACHVRPDEVAGYFGTRRDDPHWRGCNITIPHKQAVQPYLDGFDARACAVGAVNTVYRRPDGALVGTNTDVDGVGEAIAGAELTGPVVVIGAGGAARAAFTRLAELSGTPVRIVARNDQKALQAAKECGLEATVAPFNEAPGALEGASLLINATQLGMVGEQPMPLPILDALGLARSEVLVFDMVYAPLETELLREARTRGLRTSDGLTMLVGQAATAFEHFYGTAPPRERDEDLRERLIA